MMTKEEEAKRSEIREMLRTLSILNDNRYNPVSYMDWDSEEDMEYAHEGLKRIINHLRKTPVKELKARKALRRCSTKVLRKG